MKMDDITCVYWAEKTSDREGQRLRRLVNEAKWEAINRKEKPEIIKKEELKNHKWVIVEIKRDWESMFSMPQKSVKFALVEVAVDEEKEKMSGTEVMVCGRELRPRVEKYEFFLNKYGKTWRAWTGATGESTDWDS